jgi:hypothetical protein
MVIDLAQVPYRSVRSWSTEFGQGGFEPEPAPTALKPAFDLGFCVPHQNGQVRRSGENWHPESDFRPSPARVSQQACPKNPRKPATQRGLRSGGEHGSYGNWRRERDSNQQYARRTGQFVISKSRRLCVPDLALFALIFGNAHTEGLRGTSLQARAECRNRQDQAASSLPPPGSSCSGEQRSRHEDRSRRQLGACAGAPLLWPPGGGLAGKAPNVGRTRQHRPGGRVILCRSPDQLTHEPRQALS